MALTRIHHIGIAVHDADKTAEVWRDTFGLETALDTELESQGVRGVIFPLDNCEIELLQPTRDDTGISKYLEANGEGFHHICFESTDVGSDLIAAKASGMEMIDEEPRQGLTGMIGFIHPKSNHGVLIEYAQPPDDAAQHSGPASGPGPHALHHMTVAVSDVAPVQGQVDRTLWIGSGTTPGIRGPGAGGAVPGHWTDRHRAGASIAGQRRSVAAQARSIGRGHVHARADRA